MSQNIKPSEEGFFIIFRLLSSCLFFCSKSSCITPDSKTFDENLSSNLPLVRVLLFRVILKILIVRFVR
jgi:hypothetical protein